MPYPQSLEGEVGRYERWDVERHTDAFVELCADPTVMRFLGGRQRPEAARQVSERLADHWDTFGFGLWAVLGASDRLAGFAGACRPGPGWEPELVAATEVGWRLARWAWGRGFATEGGRLALAAGGDHLDLAEMIAFVNPGNTRSQAVVRRLGMSRRSGTLDRWLGINVDVFAVEVG